MQRGKLWMLAGCVVILGACSDSPSALKPAPTAASFLVTPPGNLDQSVLAILSLYPKGLETAATTRWSNIKSKYAAGLKDPAQMAVAKSMLAELTDWLGKKTPDMATPPDGETRTSATARAVLYMSMYVFNGPAATPPAYSPTADAVTGLVTPGAPATIVTPTKHAGVQLEAGSVDETTIIVITQNLTPYPDNCSGPLQTKLCQYPQFYTFEQFPHKTLLKPAKFNACHINAGESRRPLADHDRFRLAHSKPANPADYTPGSVIRDQNGESIEILPLVPQTFSTCEGNAYGTETIGSASTSMVSRLARAVKKIVTPRTAYAIDLGLGGLSRSFSQFNDVDPLGTPDRAVENVTVSGVCELIECLLHPGDSAEVSFRVSNTGTADASPVSAQLSLVAAAVEGPPVVIPFATVGVPQVVPLASATQSVRVAIPVTLAPGGYGLRVTVGDEPTFPEAPTALSNNTSQVEIQVAAGSAPSLVRVCATSGESDPPTVAQVAEAVRLVAQGGTVRICDGTYVASNIDLTGRTITIEADGPGVPTLDADGRASVFAMLSEVPVPDAVVTLRGLRLQNAMFADVSVQRFYGSVLLDHMEFLPTHGVPPNPSDPVLAYSSGLFVFNTSGNGVTVQNSTFIGGDIGVHENTATNVVVVNNTFTGQTNASIHGDGGGMTAAANIIRTCGTHWCIGLFGSTARGNDKVLGNVINVPPGTRTENAIQVFNSVVEIGGNEITGTGGDRVPSDPATWPLGSAIAIDGASSAVLTSNAISGAHTGFRIFNGTSVSATDNIVSNISQGFSSFQAGQITVIRSDFTNYTSAFGGSGVSGSLRCNWWGSSEGPSGVEGPTDAAVYTPWAVQPIARQTGVSCPPT